MNNRFKKFMPQFLQNGKKPKTGKGRFNNVDYNFSLTANENYGHYTCRIGRAVLDTPGFKFETSPFRVGGLNWILTLKHSAEGAFSAFISLVSEVQHQRNVEVHASFEVVNKDPDPTQSVRGGLTSPFRSNERWGVQLPPALEFTNPHGGFLDNSGHFVVAVEMKVVRPEDEWQAPNEVDENTRTMTWTIRNPGEWTPWMLQSHSCTVDSHHWRIQLFPRGFTPGGTYASLYAICSNTAEFGWSVRLTAVNHVHPGDSVSNVTLRRTEGQGLMCGSNNFLPRSSLELPERGFLRNGHFTIRVEFHRTPAMPSPDELQLLEDLKEEPGTRLDEGVALNIRTVVVNEGNVQQCMFCYRPVREKQFPEDRVCICPPPARVDA